MTAKTFLVAAGIFLTTFLAAFGQNNQTVYTNDFEGTVGSEWSNPATDVTSWENRRFLGQFWNQAVNLNLTNLPAHNNVVLSFDLFIIRTWDGWSNNPANIWAGPDAWALRVTDGPILLHTTFLTHDFVNESTTNRVQSYPDFYPGGSHPLLTGATEVNKLGFDRGNGEIMDAVYRLTFTFPNTNGSLQLVFSANGLQEIVDESWGLDNVSVAVETIPANSPPVFVKQPQSGLFLTESSAVLSAAVSSLEPVTYEWLLNGTSLAGASNLFLALDRLTTNHAGDYSLRAANRFGAVTSAVAQLSIVKQPKIQSVTEWVRLDLDGGATGQGPFTYQWFSNGHEILHATNAILSFGFAALDNTGNYSVRVRNRDGEITTSPAKVIVNAPVNVPVYTTDFEAGARMEWSDHWASVTPNGNRRFLGPFSNQIVSLTLTNLPPHTEVNLAFDLFIIRTWDGNNNTFGPDIWALGFDGSNTLLNTTFGNLPDNQSYPSDYLKGQYPGRTGAAEVRTLGFKWGLEDWDAVYNMNYQFSHSSNSLTVEFSAMGLESLANESWGIDNVVVSLANVPTNAPPIITSLPRTQIVRAGDPATFVVGNKTSSQLSYQWQFEGNNINGATNAFLVLTNVTADRAGIYSVTVSNPFGSMTRAPAELAVLTAQPQSHTVNAGGTATFTVGARGLALKYQWRFNGEDWPSATNSTLTLSNVQPAQAGDYTVLVANGASSLLSETAALSVPLAGEPGSIIWEFTAENSVRSTPAIGADGTIYFSDMDGYLYALNPDGTKKWSYALGYGSWASPAIGVDGTVYVVAASRVFAINADGTKKWVLATPSYNLSSPAIGSDGTIYFGLCNYTNLFYALNPDGTKKWEFVAGSRIFSSPAIGADGTIYFGALDNNKVFALSPDGAKKWELTTGGAVYSSPAIGADGTIYIGANDGKLYAIRPDGTKKWEFQTGGAIGSPPSIDRDGTIYFGSGDGNFYALRADKTIKWKFTGGASFLTSCPAVSDGGTVYFQNDKNILYAFSSDGIKKWEFATGGQYVYELRAGPTIAKNGTVYFGANDSKLYAIKGDSGPANSPWPMFRRDLQHTARVRAMAEPQNLSVSLGANATFRVQTTEIQGISFQWYFNETMLQGVTNASLTVSNVTTAQAGDYTVVVTQGGLSQTFSSMSLAVDSTFTKITAGEIVNDGSYYSPGGSWGDYDNDGFMDLFVPGTPNLLYHNLGDGTFSRVTGTAVEAPASSNCSAWADYDNDGLLDLFVGNLGNKGNFLYRNLGLTFQRITTGSIVTDLGSSYGCAWGDYDADGNLDLFVANSVGQTNFLYRGNGDGSFTRVTSSAAVNESGDHREPVWVDYDDDGDIDLFVTTTGGPNELFRNDGNGRLVKITASPLVDTPDSFRGCAWADYDGDGDLDVFISRRSDQSGILFENMGHGTFSLRTPPAIASTVGGFVGCTWGDYDNDGWVDLFVPNSTGNNVLFHNVGGEFTRVITGSLVNEGGKSFGAAWADFDNDGFLDLFVSNTEGVNNFLYRNNGNGNHWLKVKLVGTLSNRSAIGAKARVLANISGTARWQLRYVDGGGTYGQNPLVQHFGLGDATKIETLRIEWPSGIVQEFANLAVNQSLTITEPPALSVGLGATPAGFELILTSRGGFNYAIESSSNLVGWSYLTPVSNVNGSVQVVDSQAKNLPYRFYRAVTIPRTVQVDKTEAGTPVVLIVGDFFEVVLDENPSTGYHWEEVPGQTNIIQKVGEAYVSSHPGLPGASGKRTFRFVAVAAGQATLTFNLMLPGVQPPAETLEFKVLVK
jgi:outer membrane protein assembly factor BamB